MNNNKNKLLFDDENIIIVSPMLAQIFGLGQAVFLQQLHFWLKHKSKNPTEDDYKKYYHNNKWWNYKVVESKGTKGKAQKTKSWTIELPFLSPSTIRRYVDELTQKGVIITGKFNAHGYDQTLWYTIDYDKLSVVIKEWCEVNNKPMPDGIGYLLDPEKDYYIGSPVLAVALGGGNNGLTKALMLQSIHSQNAYKKKLGNELDYDASLYRKYYKDGEWYTPMSHNDWLDIFPFLSDSGIKRALKDLTDKELFKKAIFNPSSQTVSYAINYPMLDDYVKKASKNDSKPHRHSFCQNDPTLGQNDKIPFAQNDPTLGQNDKIPFAQNDPTPGQNDKHDTKDIKETYTKDTTATAQAPVSGSTGSEEQAKVLAAVSQEENLLGSSCLGSKLGQSPKKESQNPELTTHSEANQKATELFANLSLTPSDIEDICRAADYDTQKLLTAKAKLDSSGFVRNPAGFLIASLKNGWAAAQPKPKSAFHNFKEREYSDDFMANLELVLTGHRA